MSALRLADLRLDLRDIPGVTFVATSLADGRVEVAVTVDDPAVVDATRRAVTELARRHLAEPVELTIDVVGVRRTRLLLETELREVPGVRSVELRRGPRGEVLAAAVTTDSAAASRRVRELVDDRAGRWFRERRVRIAEVADSGA